MKYIPSELIIHRESKCAVDLIPVIYIECDINPRYLKYLELKKKNTFGIFKSILPLPLPYNYLIILSFLVLPLFI